MAVPFQRCQERQGAEPSPRVPRRVRALPSVPSRQLCSLLWHPEPALFPSRAGLSQRQCPRRCSKRDTAGLEAGLCTPWPGPLTLGIPPWVRDVGPVLVLIPGQPQQGLCLLNLDVSGHLQLYCRADHLNPSSCTCWSWSCWEELHYWKKTESLPFCRQHPHGAEHSACDFQSCCQHSWHSDLQRRYLVQLHGPGPWD